MGPTRIRHRPGSGRAGRLGFLVVVLGLAAITASLGVADTRTRVGPVRETSGRQDQLTLAREHIKHIVFLIKENRTFDTMFGRFPGANGARYGRICGKKQWVFLKRPADRTTDI